MSQIVQFVQARERLVAYLPLIARLMQSVLWMALAWLAGQAIMQTLDSRTLPDLPKVTLAKPISVVNGEANLLYGEPKPISVPKPEIKPEAEKRVSTTRLNLKLIGLIGVGEKGVALIQQGAKTLVVGMNETVQPGVVLVSVFAGGVLLDNRGQQEKLLLDQVTPGGLLEKARVETSPPANALDADQQTQLTEIGEKLKKSPMSISQYIRFQPINEGGLWVGVKLWSKKDKALYRALGFAEGDVLKEVNGKTIQEMATNPDLWKAFLNESQFELVVERGGSMETISVNFDR